MLIKERIVISKIEASQNTTDNGELSYLLQLVFRKGKKSRQVDTFTSKS
jgi:hypothetical protein